MSAVVTQKSSHNTEAPHEVTPVFMDSIHSYPRDISARVLIVFPLSDQHEIVVSSGIYSEM